MAEAIPVGLVQFGLGKVGQALAQQVMQVKDDLRERLGIDLFYCFIADRSGMVWSPTGMTADGLEKVLAWKQSREPVLQLVQVPAFVGEEGEAAPEAPAEDATPAKKPTGRLVDMDGANPAADPATVVRLLTKNLEIPTLMIDVTAGTSTVAAITTALKEGWGVVLANKEPLAIPLAEHKDMFAAQLRPGILRYEATVGAGLPVISTLHTLLTTGDTVESIKGTFSGTLGYLLTQMDQGSTFSSALREARRLGYTEPDPREDLSGADVARKALILARTAGMDLDYADIVLEPFVDKEMWDIPPEELDHYFASLNEIYALKIEKAWQGGHILRYIAEIRGDKTCTVGLREVLPSSPFGLLRGTDSLILFNTKRYPNNPLCVQGPGAGAEVTASGVLGDIVTMLEMLVG